MPHVRVRTAANVLIFVSLMSMLTACTPMYGSPTQRAAKNAANSDWTLCMQLQRGFLAPEAIRAEWTQEISRRGINCAQTVDRNTQVERDTQVVQAYKRRTGGAKWRDSSLIDVSGEEICQLAITAQAGRQSVWNTNYNYEFYVGEAKRRGLTPRQCAQILGRTTQVARAPATEPIGLAGIAHDSLCIAALAVGGGQPSWDRGNTYIERYVAEAESRGLTPQRCAQILGRNPRIAETPKARPKDIEQTAPAPIPRKKPTPKTPEVVEKPPSSEIVVATSGSGFFVSKLGHVVTNEHVVKECKTITVGDNANQQISVEVIDTDRKNDLALVKLSSTSMASAETKSLISKLGIQIASKSGQSAIPLSSNGLLRSDDVELGETVMVAGYPFGNIFSNAIKVTGGMVSAIRGMGDDSGQFQMDAAVQPGNSGGPIYDENGNIVGVVVSQLNKLNFAKAIGSLPENVNFGIKASTVRQFLTSSGLPTKWSERSQPMSTKELAKIAKSQTVMVVCNQ